MKPERDAGWSGNNMCETPRAYHGFSGNCFSARSPECVCTSMGGALSTFCMRHMRFLLNIFQSRLLTKMPEYCLKVYLFFAYAPLTPAQGPILKRPVGNLQT